MAEYIFLRTAWMKHYRGVKNDTPVNGGSHIKEHHNGLETRNFLPVNGKYYGGAYINNSIDLKKYGAKRGETYIDGITIIWFARKSKKGGQYIVGWYKNARLYSELQRKGGRLYIAEAAPKDVKLINEQDRAWPILQRKYKKQDHDNMKGFPGTSAAWNAKLYMKPEYFRQLESYMRSPDAYLAKNATHNKGGRAWQKNIELKNKVEHAAMDSIQAYFEARRYIVNPCYKDNLGWDLEAVSGGEKLLLEVKGLSGSLNTVELTHNEYGQSKVRAGFRICVVSNALDKKKRQIDIFKLERRLWINQDENKILEPKELIAARFTLKQ